jgi:hypothetical protein
MSQGLSTHHAKGAGALEKGANVVIHVKGLLAFSTVVRQQRA